jgi:hypothetical protein
MCYPRAVVQDRWPLLMRTSIPQPLCYPVAPYGFDFVHALCKLFYGSTVIMQLQGLLSLAKLSLWPPKGKVKAA